MHEHRWQKHARAEKTRAKGMGMWWNRMTGHSAGTTFLSLQRGFKERVFGLVTCSLYTLKSKHVGSNTVHGLRRSGAGGGVGGGDYESGFSGSQNEACYPLSLGLVHQAEGHSWFLQPKLQAPGSQYESLPVPVGQRYIDWQFQEWKKEQSDKEITLIW